MGEDSLEVRFGFGRGRKLPGLGWGRGRSQRRVEIRRGHEGDGFYLAVLPVQLSGLVMWVATGEGDMVVNVPVWSSRLVEYNTEALNMEDGRRGRHREPTRNRLQ